MFLHTHTQTYTHKEVANTFLRYFTEDHHYPSRKNCHKNYFSVVREMAIIETIHDPTSGPPGQA